MESGAGRVSESAIWAGRRFSLAAVPFLPQTLPQEVGEAKLGNLPASKAAVGSR